MSPIWEHLTRARAIDLAHPWHQGMPVSPNHPPYQMALVRRHGDMVRADGGSAASEVLIMGGHVGTHIDALCHVSHDGYLHGDIEAVTAQSGQGFSNLGIETAGAFFCRGVLLDIPRVLGVEVLDPGYEITAHDLDRASDHAGVDVRPGDAVMIRSGWSRHWWQPEVFAGQAGGAPGPGEEGARWLAEREVSITGAETLAYEVISPGAGHALLPVHRLLIVEHGIHIIEVMRLDDLAAQGVSQFGFVAIPLGLKGATGSPTRPYALIDG